MGENTLINLDGPVARVVEVSGAKVKTEPRRQPLRARDIGQVYGVALDREGGLQPGARPPNIYLAATSAYGLSIVGPAGESRKARLERGAPGTEWGAGAFGTALGGGPGSIWKIDGATGRASLFADIRLDGIGNSGPALGQLAFDPRTR